jgi:uncharacterized protein YkwD
VGRLRAPGPILLLVLSSMVLEARAVAFHPLTASLVAAHEQVPPDPNAPSVSPTATPQPSIDDLEAEMLARLNAERAAAGVGTLQNQPWAQSVARQHSEDMAAAGNIWHDMAGYMGQGRRSLGATSLGENVSMDSTLEANDARLFASPEHHRNIVDPHFNYVGIGVARDAKDWVYVTEDFSGIPGTVAAQAVQPALAPASPVPAPVPPGAAGAPAPPPAPVPPPSPRGAQRAPGAAQPAPAAAAPAPAGGLTAASPPDLAAKSPLAPTTPGASPVQGGGVPAPVEAPSDQVAAGAVALAAPAPTLPTAAPLDDAAPSRDAAPGASQPLPPWLSQAKERARPLPPAAGVALFLGVLLFSRGIPGTARPPHVGDPVVAGSVRIPLGPKSPGPRRWILELPRGPPAVRRVRGCFA